VVLGQVVAPVARLVGVLGDLQALLVGIRELLEARIVVDPVEEPPVHGADYRIRVPGKVRRIVTGHNQAGRSVIISDTLLPPGEVDPSQPLRVGLWLTDSAPASNAGNPDPVADGTISKIPPQHRGGTVIRITDIPPDGSRPANAQGLASRGAIVTPDRTARHPGFHQTHTVDYAICLEGEIYAVLDEGETLMRPGDVLIQRGTQHAWSNRGQANCRMLFVLIDAEPAR
jgi:quercetin dioxygenase-like cupin family protein